MIVALLICTSWRDFSSPSRRNAATAPVALLDLGLDLHREGAARTVSESLEHRAELVDARDTWPLRDVAELAEPRARCAATPGPRSTGHRR